MTATSIAEWIKMALNPAIAWIVLICSSIFLTSPDNVLKRLGVDSIRREFLGWFGCAFIFSISAVLYHIAYILYRKVAKYLQYLSDVESRYRLAPPEKAILKRYIDGRSKTQSLQFSNPNVQSLIAENVLFFTAFIGQLDDVTTIHISSWAWDHLNKHRNLLDG
jgi:Super-infection exclusion protein B